MIGCRKVDSPLVIAIGFYIALLALALIRIYSFTHLQQLYLLDDTYIHLSIAKTLLYHHVYGLSPTETAFASSSIIWPFLLVGVGAVFGLHTLLPLVLNVIFAIALLMVAFHILRQNGIDSWRVQTATLMLLVLAFPLVTMTLDGMEHVLYGVAFLLFLQLAGTAIAEGADRSGTHAIWLIASAALLTSCRYEGAFAIFVAWLLLIRRRFLLANAVAVAGALPILIFGLFSRTHGGMWVPNSLVMKTAGLALYQRVLFIPRQMRHFYIWECGILTLVLLLVWIAWRTRKDGLTAPVRSMLLLFLGTALFHLQFARLTAVTPRYESYLIGAGVVLAAITLAQMHASLLASNQPLPVTAKVLAVLAVLPLIAYRGVCWQFLAPNAAKSIYLQQYQAARFFSQYYRGAPIVANDVGLVSYKADTDCLDLWGLANNRIAIRIAQNAMNTAVMREMAQKRNVHVGFLYTMAFTGVETPPAEWKIVETWTSPLDPGHTTANATISLYATTPEDAAILKTHLDEFRHTLPSQVIARAPDGTQLH